MKLSIFWIRIKNNKKKLKSKGLNNLKKYGFGLMEVVVSLAISMLGITSAAVFSNHIITRAQLNFYRQAATQLQGLMVENVKYIFYAMEEVKNQNPSITASNWGESTINRILSYYSKEKLCSDSEGSINLSLNSLTSVVGSSARAAVNVKAAPTSGDLLRINTKFQNQYGTPFNGAGWRWFEPVNNNQLNYGIDNLNGKLGGIEVGSNNTFWYSIRPIPAGLGNPSDGENIRVDIVVAFTHLPVETVTDSTIIEFTDPVKLRFKKSSICP